MRFATGWFLSLMLVWGAGCASTPALQFPGIPVAPARVAALPSEVKVFEYDFDGRRAFDSARTGDERSNVDASIGYLIAQHGGHSFRSSALTELPEGSRFYHWTIDALTEILAERIGESRRRHRTVGDWRFPGPIAPWRQTLNADFVLISMFIDGHDTVGRAFSVDNTRAARRAIACLVHLESGRIVRCQVNDPLPGKLTSRPEAQTVVDGLLTGILAAG